MKHELFIAGKWHAAHAGGTLDVVDPATEEVFHCIAAGTAADVAAAVQSASNAIKGEWGVMRGAERAAYLRALAAQLRDSADTLACLEVRDNGKPLPEAKWDVDDSIACFEYYAELAEQLDELGDESIALPDARFVSRVTREPVGVCGLIIPWNYPLLMAAWKVAPALAAGCTMVLKPSEYTSLTALELGTAAHDISLPPGVLNIVTGTGRDSGAPIVQHARIDKVAFTGSVATGTAVMQAAARGIKNISLELGGKSPLIVFDDAPLDAAVEWILFGVFWNQGEVCSATSRLLVEANVADELLQRLIESAQKVVIGNGMQEGVKLGPLVSKAQHDRVLGFIERAKRAGCTPVCGGGRPQSLERGYFLEPTIFKDVPVDNEIWREEVFGPVLCVRTFRTEAEAIALANDSRYGLAAAVLTADDARAERVAKAMRAGIVWINCSQPTFVQAPWGGMKMSGIGRELGRWGLDNYLAVKQVTRYTSQQPWGWYS
jgi:betaine-aldehyde dehydrogenase